MLRGPLIEVLPQKKPLGLRGCLGVLDLEIRPHVIRRIAIDVQNVVPIKNVAHVFVGDGTLFGDSPGFTVWV